MSRISHGSLLASLLVSSVLLAASPPAFAKKFAFDMPVSAGAATCLPNAKAHVIVTPNGATENMHVRATGLPPNTNFDLFVIQVPTAPFGFSWYQGDLETDANGIGNGDFVGRFSVETTVVDPNSAAAPVVFPTDAASNPAPLDSQRHRSRPIILDCGLAGPRTRARPDAPTHRRRSTANTMPVSRC